MDSYTFYSSIYNRELNRRKDLDNAINIPATILTLIVGLNSIYTDKVQIINSFRNFELVDGVLILIVIAILVSIFFLMKSYNNLFKGFSYRNLALTRKIRQFEIKDIAEYYEQVEEKDRLRFETELVNRIICITDNHILFNDKGSLDLYRAKTFLILSLILTGIKLVIIKI